MRENLTQCIFTQGSLASLETLDSLEPPVSRVTLVTLAIPGLLASPEIPVSQEQLASLETLVCACFVQLFALSQKSAIPTNLKMLSGEWLSY